MPLSYVTVGQPMLRMPESHRLKSPDDFKGTLPTQFALIDRSGTVVEIIPSAEPMTLARAVPDYHHSVKGEIRKVIDHHYGHTLLTIYLPA